MPQNQIFPINPTEVPELKFSGSGTNGFKPHYSPRDMLLLGVFNGTFFNTLTSRKGLPPELWEDMASSHFESLLPDPNANFFQVEVPLRNRQSEVSPLARMQDPGGWYQWYCKFFYGRRIPELDNVRINQWRNEVVTLFHYIKFGTPPDGYTGNKIEDIELFKPYRQQLLHFGWDSRIDPLSFGIRL